MARMIRKQLYIEPWQEERLKQRSRELGVTEAELIRQGIDSVVAGNVGRRTPDPEAWREILAFIERQMSKEAPQTGRDWTREEIYEERLSRLFRRH